MCSRHPNYLGWHLSSENSLGSIFHSLSPKFLCDVMSNYNYVFDVYSVKVMYHNINCVNHLAKQFANKNIKNSLLVHIQLLVAQPAIYIYNDFAYYSCMMLPTKKKYRNFLVSVVFWFQGNRTIGKTALI
jgi:hypothetical protein